MGAPFFFFCFFFFLSFFFLSWWWGGESGVREGERCPLKHHSVCPASIFAAWVATMQMLERMWGFRKRGVFFLAVPSLGGVAPPFSPSRGGRRD